MTGDNSELPLSPRQLFVAGLLIGLIILAVGPAFSALFTNSVSVTNVTLHAPSGPSGTFIGSGDANLTEPFPDANTVEFNSTFANVTIWSASRTNVTFDSFDSDWTNMSGIDATSARLNISRNGFSYVGLGDDVESFNLSKTVAMDDGETDFIYEGASGSTNVTLTNLPANDNVFAVEDGNFKTLDSVTTNADGNATFVMPNSRHSVQLLSQSNNVPPVLDDDTATPTGAQNDFPSQLEIQVNDSNFPDGDSVDLVWRLDGSQVGTQTITSNGTYSQSVSISSGGDHNWSISATDESDETDIGNFSFTTPATGSIFKETAPETKVTKTVELTFYPHESDRVFNETTSNGDFNLTDLPLNQDITIVAEPQSDYYDRRIIIESLADQPRLYLLNKSEDAVNVSFTLTDRTGRFPDDETELFIRKPINRTRNGNTTEEFEFIAGDLFGQDGIAEDLQAETRYRLLVKNQDNEVAVLGKITTGTSDESIPLAISQINTSLDFEDGYFVNTSYVNASSGNFVRFQYRDVKNETNQLKVKIHERNDPNNVIFDKTFPGPLGNVTVTEPLSAAQENKTWVVNYTADRFDNTISGQDVVGQAQSFQLTDMPWWLQQFVALMGIFIIAGMASQLNAQTGAVTAAMFGGLFWYIGFLPGEVGGGIAVLAILFSGAFYLRTRQRPT